MIPNPSDDEDDRARVIPAGRPRPKPKQNKGKPPKANGVRVESGGNNKSFRNKFMAMSQDTRSGPAQPMFKKGPFGGKEVTRQAQKPIKVRTNVFNSRKVSQQSSMLAQEQKIEAANLSQQ